MGYTFLSCLKFLKSEEVLDAKSPTPNMLKIKSVNLSGTLRDKHSFPIGA